METLQFGLLLSSFLSSHRKQSSGKKGSRPQSIQHVRINYLLSETMWSQLWFSAESAKTPILKSEKSGEQALHSKQPSVSMNTSSFNHCLQSSKHYSESEVVHMLEISPLGRLRQKDDEFKLKIVLNNETCPKKFYIKG